VELEACFGWVVRGERFITSGIAQSADGCFVRRSAAKRSGFVFESEPIKIDRATVAMPFPLRLIRPKQRKHGRSACQKVYTAGLGSNSVLATRENLLLPAQPWQGARRISSVHLQASEEMSVEF